MLIIEKMKDQKFSDSQQAVIDYIIKESENIEKMTIQEIAKACYTSNATLIRLAHKLGYNGWDAFKADFIKEQQYLTTHFSTIDANIPFHKKESLASIIHKISALKIAAIEETEALLKPGLVRKAAELLDQADTIIVTGQNNTIYFAQNFAIKLGRIGRRCSAYTPNSEIRFNHELERKNNVLIVISYSGETHETIPTLMLAKKNGLPIIAITSIGESTISKNSTLVLPICTREKIYSKISWYTSETAINYVLDTLYSALFWKNYDESMHLRIATARQNEYQRVAHSSILAEDQYDNANTIPKPKT